MDFEVVPIAAEHIEAFHCVLDVVARERKYLAFLEAPPLEQAREFIMRNIAQNNVQLAAFAGGELIGWADVLPKDRPIHSHVGVLGIGLLPAVRGKGIGAALMHAALQGAQQRGYVRIELTVRAENARAVALYEQFGFEKEGVCRDAILFDGRYEDLIMMANIDRSRAQPG
jgi:RimJ/RimL family protein N-acetyltransferase